MNSLTVSSKVCRSQTSKRCEEPYSPETRNHMVYSRIFLSPMRQNEDSYQERPSGTD